MPVPISDWLFGDYLKCKYKAFRKLSGESRVKSDFEKYQDENHAEYCQRARVRLLIAGGGTTPHAVNSTFKEIKKQTISVAVGISISNDKYSLILNAAELASQSSPGKPLYNPIIFLPHQKISKQHKLLLAFYGSALGHEQKIEPASGRIIFGDNLYSTKVQLTSLLKTVHKIEKEITNMIDKQTAPPLRLNDHCKTCEFQDICYVTAKEKDDLSLMKGLSVKEIDQLNKRGIFTVTQYSYTFRPRRAKKTASRQILKYHHSLNALAIRTQTIYIAGKPEIPAVTTRVYLDVEGIPDENFYYLIGLVIDDGKSVSSHSFWANDKSGENIIWGSFLEKMEALKDFVLFHYGSYETKFLKQMDGQYGGSSELLERIKSHSFNVLSAIYGHIYFPTYSNGLKSIASLLGFKWTDHNASGLMSLLWRQQCEASGNDIFKQKLITYNNEDCQALRTIVNYLEGLSTTNNSVQYRTKHTDQIKRDKPYDIFRENNFCFPDLEKINRCAYFDYQRDKVYARISPLHRKSITKKAHKFKRNHKVNQTINLSRPKKCPQCNAMIPYRHANYSKIVYDIKMHESGIKRWVIKYIFSRFRCKKCSKAFVPTIYKEATASKYGQHLMAWVIYQHIGRLKSQHGIIEDLQEIFKYHFPMSIFGDFKTRAASCYKSDYNELWSALLNGTLLHVDETKVNVRGMTNYVWAFTNIDTVYYMHTNTREGDFLKEKLSGFKGVFVSDFYTTYDSISCVQQKCLIHLIRDMNEDILRSPFDLEMKELGKDFTALLTPIIETIDKYGLKKRHLHLHERSVLRFFKKIEGREYSSELAKNFRRRMVKYRDKLFPFLFYDGIPWNNNNAEHAIKRFVFLRNVINGQSTEESIKENLVLLSICETLRLRNASFFNFLLSGDTDIDKFLERKTNRLA
ncbi:TM0106 family RecB-like putative nuclease [candidate division WS5 bacterium]|uniref:TM0106 family RecB-like putative nuclease n=1 Tax=candidate division WS5 bacterium TaxID=2093353 RepID=A0A419DF68_9BACT|nr:MAG: TM0106 family RecB-like putative nuclease [candidate division WS5 bacterium]